MKHEEDKKIIFNIEENIKIFHSHPERMKMKNIECTKYLKKKTQFSTFFKIERTSIVNSKNNRICNGNYIRNFMFMHIYIDLETKRNVRKMTCHFHMSVDIN